MCVVDARGNNDIRIALSEFFDYKASLQPTVAEADAYRELAYRVKAIGVSGGILETCKESYCFEDVMSALMRYADAIGFQSGNGYFIVVWRSVAVELHLLYIAGEEVFYEQLAVLRKLFASGMSGSAAVDILACS